MDILDRPIARAAPSRGAERAGYALVAVGYVVMTLGILEIGGLFNVVLGLAVAWAGCLLMFAGEWRRGHEEEEAFRRQLDQL